jgi:hypothetical protein
MAFRRTELAEHIIVGGYDLPLSITLPYAQGAGIEAMEQACITQPRNSQTDRIEGLTLELQVLPAYRFRQNGIPLVGAREQAAKYRPVSAHKTKAIEAMATDGSHCLFTCGTLIREIDQQVVIIPQHPHSLDLFQTDRAEVHGLNSMQSDATHYGSVG